MGYVFISITVLVSRFSINIYMMEKVGLLIDIQEITKESFFVRNMQTILSQKEVFAVR